MLFELTSAAVALALLMALWMTPLLAFLVNTDLRGLEKFNWALLIGVLSWPAFALYLLYSGIRQRKP